MNIHTVVAKFAVEIIEPVNAGEILLKPVAVHAVFAEIGMHDEITVL